MNPTSRHLELDRDWSFRRLGPGPGEGGWTRVDLPHCPFVADLDGRDHWFGECEYRRSLQIAAPEAGARYVLFVGAAMHTARVFVDDAEVGRHEGGYLPFEVDLTGVLASGVRRELALRLDNRHDPDVPPGKPFADLDFCWYGGLYRGVQLRIYPEVHITDPVAAGETGGGGIFVRTLEASEARAVVGVRTHVRNDGPSGRPVRVRVRLLHEGREVATGESAVTSLAARSGTPVGLELAVDRPHLWSPGSPALHEAQVAVVAGDGSLLDAHDVRCGIRRLAFSRSGGFTVNGRRLRLRGTNRHQEYPCVGYAVPRAAQVRDARRIKEAGFDYVRLSHYPQSPDFLAACDELGIVVMNCLPGWQFIGSERFREACYENARQLIRRDRNHPSVVLWELSLNETPMDEGFMARLHAIGHEEYPGDQMFTCGWIDRFDVFTHSRQHGEIHRWRNDDKALVIAEYGDWEFYAVNGGFDQKTGAGLLADESNSRKSRGDGERGLRQQAANHIVALEDTLSSPAVLDGQWAMFDYARGYHPARAACGVMDVFRLPKFSYHFYRSQRGPGEGGAGWTGGPMVFVASHWTPSSDRSVQVFSNCEEVELCLNGVSLGRQKPERTRSVRHLPHPPVVFELPAFVPGTLEATGFIGGQLRAAHAVSTPGAPARIEIVVDDLGIRAGPAEPDLLIAHARICDAHGILRVDDRSPVVFSLEGGGGIVGPSSVSAEAGVASVVIGLRAGTRSFLVRAELADGSCGPVACRWDTDNGAAPSPQSAALPVIP